MSKRPFFKNPAREQNQKHKPYVPQYKIRGLEPEYIASATVPETMNRVQSMRQAPPRSNENPRLRPPPSISNNVPYAELPNEVINFGSIPNVGNNIENSWGPNDEFFDVDENLTKDIPQQLLIDNNQYDNANYANIPEALEAPPTERNLSVYEEYEIAEPKDYILVVKDNVISHGSLKEIEKEVKLLVFGEHPLCSKNEIATDDIVVLKKMKIKVGVFIE